ncbi:MAG: penicillin acylase family protein, partial [Gemmatimonadota bacterium]
NPHLSWDAGYYEAHVTVPGQLNFYGDFRIGGPFGIIGGFNEHLGWSTTNNYPDLDQIYALRVDPERPDHVLLDGESVPLTRDEVSVEVKNGPGLSRVTRTAWHSPLGPVIHRAGGRVYVTRSAEDGRFRRGEQFLRMMQAGSLAEWKRAMRIRGRTKSNFTYADDRGNVYYVWNARMPRLPHASGGDTAAVEASDTDEVWTRLVPYDSLPQLLNPEGGYLHQENDPFHYTNLYEVFDADRFPEHYPEPALGLRSQLSLQLVGGGERLTLEEVVRRKHSPRMLLADRVKPDLLEALRAAGPSGRVAAGVRILEAWENRAAHESRGAVLFETWWDVYLATADSARETPASAGFEAEPGDLFAEPWTPERPTETPRGLGDPDRAVEAFRAAADSVTSRWGRLDVSWGHVHRVRRGDVDAPVAGCSGSMGCFRVLWYDRA